MKKLIVVGIIILLVGMGVPSTGLNVERSNASFDRNTLYVGGSGPGNYTRIQDAIDNASSGDTVFVYNGTYKENLIVNKSINLIGEDKNTTIIDGNQISDGLFITADGVVVNDFKIINCFYGWQGIGVGSSYNNISNNIIENNTYGIYIYDYNNHNKFYHNIISSCTNSSTGISAQYGTNYIDIMYNTFSVRRDGMYFYTSKHVNIIGNTLTDFSNGVFMDDCSFFNISDNIFSEWHVDGIYSNDCKNMIIMGNTFKRTSWGLHFLGTKNCRVFHNSFIRNGETIHVGGNNNSFLENNFIQCRFRSIIITNAKNEWDRNYWNWPRIFPKPIFRIVIVVFGDSRIILDFDWHPAKEPYDIGV